MDDVEGWKKRREGKLVEMYCTREEPICTKCGNFGQINTFLLGSVDVAQLVECLPTMHEALSPILNTAHRSGDTPCDPSSWEVEAGELGVQDHPQLQSKFEACLGYV